MPGRLTPLKSQIYMDLVKEKTRIEQTTTHTHAHTYTLEKNYKKKPSISQFPLLLFCNAEENRKHTSQSIVNPLVSRLNPSLLLFIIPLLVITSDIHRLYVRMRA